MQGRRFWVELGVIQHEPGDAVETSPASEKKRFEAGGVRVTSGNIGTEIKWHAQTRCISSLFVVLEWLRGARAPFVLRYYVSGWFEEFYKTAGEASQRIEAIIARGDRHFPVRTFVEEVEPVKTVLAPLLVDALNAKDHVDDYSVDCVYNRMASRFDVLRVGKKSLIARVYGDVESSHPRQTIGSYSDAVSAGYREVLESGKPRTDHVLAALRFPNNSVYWVPYHRLILPKHGNASVDGVKVISQFGKIGFKVI
ncbi:MAG: hypothetical protein KGO53_06175 [Alphaproteobacteria bacterium]|nr:hypothetical protein [Alphaproteobacteria bacterium]